MSSVTVLATYSTTNLEQDKTIEFKVLGYGQKCCVEKGGVRETRVTQNEAMDQEVKLIQRLLDRLTGKEGILSRS